MGPLSLLAAREWPVRKTPGLDRVELLRLRVQLQPTFFIEAGGYLNACRIGRDLTYANGGAHGIGRPAVHRLNASAA